MKTIIKLISIVMILSTGLIFTACSDISSGRSSSGPSIEELLKKPLYGFGTKDTYTKIYLFASQEDADTYASFTKKQGKERVDFFEKCDFFIEFQFLKNSSNNYSISKRNEILLITDKNKRFVAKFKDNTSELVPETTMSCHISDYAESIGDKFKGTITCTLSREKSVSSGMVVTSEYGDSYIHIQDLSFNVKRIEEIAF